MFKKDLNNRLNKLKSLYNISDGTRLIAIAGGKGGTGKSVFAANLGIALSNLKFTTIMMDADLGGANLHTCLGIRRCERTLSDFLTKKYDNLKDIITDTFSEDLKLISGANDMLGIANLHHSRKLKLIRHIKQLDTDYIIVDLGAGVTYNTLDFFLIADHGFIITNPDPNSKLDAYSFLKSLIYRKLFSLFKKDHEVHKLIEKTINNSSGNNIKLKELIKLIFQLDFDAGTYITEELNKLNLFLVLNKIRKKNQIQEGDIFVNLVKEFLNLDLNFIGHIRYDSYVIDAGEKLKPLLIYMPKSGASEDIYGITSRIINISKDKDKKEMSSILKKQLKKKRGEL